VVDGDDFIVECVDWTGGQIADDDSADDIRNVDLTQVHYLSGPIEVEGAEPGDLLRVEFLDLGYIEPWGFTGTFDIKKGGGLLGDEFPQALKAVWDLQGVWATSRHIPGVKLTGIIHPGLIGCAPSREVLEEWNRRERKLVETDPDRVPPLAPLPTEHGALVGKLEGTDEGEKVKKEAARTVPPREHGGNCDIKVRYNYINQN
jgi:formamidase